MGVVTGDALGVSVAGVSREDLAKSPVTSMRDGGIYGQPRGTWSDDGALTLTTVESLLTDYSLHNLMDRFRAWREEGKLSARGEVFEIDEATAHAIDAYRAGCDLFACGQMDVGNGSLKRIMPISLYFHWKKTAKLIQISLDVSRLTHAHPRAKWACAYHSVLVKLIMQGLTFGDALMRTVAVMRDVIAKKEKPAFQRLLDLSLLECDAAEIGSSNYVIDTLEAAIWCCANTHSYKEAVLFAVNLGNDTDTTGAVTGGIAGLLYGVQAIPEKWRQTLAQGERIEKLISEFRGCVGGPVAVNGPFTQ